MGKVAKCTGKPITPAPTRECKDTWTCPPDPKLCDMDWVLRGCPKLCNLCGIKMHRDTIEELNLQPGNFDDINLQWGEPENTPTPTDATEIQHSGASNAALDACRLF